ATPLPPAGQGRHAETGPRAPEPARPPGHAGPAGSALVDALEDRIEGGGALLGGWVGLGTIAAGARGARTGAGAVAGCAGPAAARGQPAPETRCSPILGLLRCTVCWPS